MLTSLWDGAWRERERGGREREGGGREREDSDMDRNNEKDREIWIGEDRN